MFASPSLAPLAVPSSLPLPQLEPTPSALYQYGSHHAKYILDGELIAFAVIDVLPGALSSVYFVWHPQWAAMGLGKLSALREAAMVREMRREGLEDMTAYMWVSFLSFFARIGTDAVTCLPQDGFVSFFYFFFYTRTKVLTPPSLGFYIHTCPKMK